MKRRFLLLVPLLLMMGSYSACGPSWEPQNGEHCVVDREGERLLLYPSLTLVGDKTGEKKDSYELLKYLSFIKIVIDGEDCWDGYGGYLGIKHSEKLHNVLCVGPYSIYDQAITCKYIAPYDKKFTYNFELKLFPATVKKESIQVKILLTNCDNVKIDQGRCQSDVYTASLTCQVR